MKKILYLIIPLLCCLTPFDTNAQNDTISTLRPVNAAYTVNIGSAHHADTYLSPIKYSGWAVGFGYQRRQAMAFAPERWIQQITFDIDVDRTENIVKNATMWYAGIDFSYAILRRWQLPDGFSIGIGPAIALNAGCLYLDRNGNNPASAKVAITANAEGYAAWNGSFFKIPVTLRYNASMPITGAFFSPDYGELYYEIYLGNHSGLCHWAWPGNYFRLRNLLTADINFGGTSLRIGYRGDIFSSKVNDIVTRTFTHCAVIGLSGEWISVNPKKKISPDAKMISATY